MISNFLDVTLGTVNINKVLLGNSLVWVRDRGLAKDYSGTGWYKATDTGTVFNKGVPDGETYIFPDDPKEYISVYYEWDAKSYADRAATSNMTDMGEMFSMDSSFNEDISHWDVSNVTRMIHMFFAASSFNQDISSWDVSNVTNMRNMFAYTDSFNQDISSWDTSSVLYMHAMFEYAESFNQDLSQWCVPHIATEPEHFTYGAYNWTLPNPVWGTCPRGEDGTVGLAKDYSGTGWYKATDTGIIYCKGVPEGETHIFLNASNDPIEYVSVYTNEDAQLYANRAATSNITDMSYMFESASSFNEDISHWDTSNVTTMRSMFMWATLFNGDISHWDTSNVTHMRGMFSSASSFNQDISSWDTSKITGTNMNEMFHDASSFNQDLSQWCVPFIFRTPSFFDSGADNWTLPRPVWGTCPRGENAPD